MTYFLVDYNQETHRYEVTGMEVADALPSNVNPHLCFVDWDKAERVAFAMNS